MADIGGSRGDAFDAGVNHPTNPGRQNLGGITMDSGLEADSERWDSLTPHGVLATAQSPGLSFEGVERQAGTAQPGGMAKFLDPMSGGSDNTTWTSEEE